jgi:hypothetical protein
MGKRGRRTRPDRYELYDMLRASLRNRGLGRGPWLGGEANRAIAPIADSVEEVMKLEIASLDAFEVVTWASSALPLARTLNTRPE